MTATSVDERSLLQPVQRVRRRAILGAFLRISLLVTSFALLVCSVAFVAAAIAGVDLAMTRKLLAVSAAVALGIVAAGIWTWIRLPSMIDAAMLLDECLGLRERFTTFLSLDEAAKRSPAGLALERDLAARFSKIDARKVVSPRFRISRWALPATAAVLAVVAVMLEPSQRPANRPDDQPQIAASDLKKKVENFLKKKADAGNTKKDKKDIIDWDELLNFDPNRRDEILKKIEEFKKLEAELKAKSEQLQEQQIIGKALREQLEAMQKLEGAGEQGLAKDILESLKKGEFGQAQERLEKLRQELAKGAVDDEELMRLVDELDKLANALKDQEELRKRREDQLARLAEEGNLDPETLEAIKKALKQLKNLENLQGELKRLKLLKLDKNVKLTDADLEKLEGILGDLEDLEDLRKNAKDADRLLAMLEAEGEMLRALRMELMQRLADGGAGRPGNTGGGPGGGKRPAPKKEATQSVTVKDKGGVDSAGKLQVIGLGKGGLFKKIDAKELPATLRRTAQQASRAIANQRVTPEAAELLRGYYRNLGKQGE